MVKKKSSRKVSVYSNLVAKRRTKKDAESRKRAEYLASLPKHPVKRFFYRLHPKRVAQFIFSKRGAFAILKTLGVIFILFVLTAGALFAYYRKDLDAIRPGEIDKRVQTTVTKYYDRNGQLLWEDKGDGDYKLVVDGDKISNYIKQATVAIEDEDFYTHGGISVTGITRALLSNSRGNATQGGSTLTQQLVKQVFFADEAQKRGLDGIPRKIKEMILSIEVERMYNKDQILNLYLNESSYGGRRNGVESAAQTYFGKSAKDLTLAESALLAAIPNSPTLYNPYNIEGHDALIERQHIVLDKMVKLKYITKSQADEAKKVAILDTIKPLSDQLSNIKAPHFVLMVREELEEELGKATVGKGGLTVTTTLDLNIQNNLEEKMTKLFNGELTGSNCGYTNCATYAGFSNGAAAIEDNKTGQILALTGSRDFNYAGFGQDNAATAFIQPGSSIKPLVYAQLFQDKGTGKTNYGSGSIISDTKTTFGGTYTPQNADGKFQGNITIRQSLDRSRNIPAIKAMSINEQNKQGSTWQTIRDMGDTYYCTQGSDADAGLSSAIGGCGTRLIDHVNAMASLARMGTYVPQSSILKVTNSTGQTLKEYTSTSKQVIDPQAAYVVNDILGDPKARAGLGGGRDYITNLTKIGAKVAVKTGTSNSEINGKVVAKDIWTVGYTPSLSMAVWLGNSDTSPLRSGNSLIPAMFFDATMTDAVQYYVSQSKASLGDWFNAPSGIQNIKNELFPSYYNKSAGQKNATVTFDRVSKKKATSCTPEGARIDVSVVKTKDDYSNKEIITAQDGYDATQDDDVHKCGDSLPKVSIDLSNGNHVVSVSYSQGTHALQTVEVKVNNQSVGSRQISASGSWGNIAIPESAGNNYTITATVTDSVYYATTVSKQVTTSSN